MPQPENSYKGTFNFFFLMKYTFYVAQVHFYCLFIPATNQSSSWCVGSRFYLSAAGLLDLTSAAQSSLPVSARPSLWSVCVRVCAWLSAVTLCSHRWRPLQPFKFLVKSFKFFVLFVVCFFFLPVRLLGSEKHVPSKTHISHHSSSSTFLFLFTNCIIITQVRCLIIIFV